MTKEHFV